MYETDLDGRVDRKAEDLTIASELAGFILAYMVRGGEGLAVE